MDAALARFMISVSKEYVLKPLNCNMTHGEEAKRLEDIFDRVEASYGVSLAQIIEDIPPASADPTKSLMTVYEAAKDDQSLTPGLLCAMIVFTRMYIIKYYGADPDGASKAARALYDFVDRHLTASPLEAILNLFDRRGTPV